MEVKHDLVSRAEGDESAGQTPQSKIHFSERAYADALAQFKTAFSDCEYFFENLMVATAMYTGFPDLESKDALWESYVSLCYLYSFYRFVSVLSCKDEATKERLFHILVLANRDILNSQGLEALQALMSKRGRSTLAHMAILLRWD